MQTSAAWYDESRVSQEGSVILKNWRASREAARAVPSVPRNDMSGMSMSDFNEWIKTSDGYAPGTISERSAMNISTVYGCVNLIGGAISSMPLTFYRRDGANEREAYKPDEWWMFNEQPCTAWGAATAWEFSAQALLLRGDSFWRILRASRLSSKIVGFEPLHPTTVQVRRVDDRNVFDVAPQLAVTSGNPANVTLDQDDMLHIPGPGFDGLRGMSQISNSLRLSGGIALSADQYMAAFFNNSARPDYVLETDAVLKAEQIQNLRDQINEGHQGPLRSHKPMVLQGGLKVKPITISAEDAQLMEIRKFQVEDVCRTFGVPPFMVGHTEKTSSWGTGVEQMGIGFVKYTLQRHLVKIEQEINRKVFRTARNFCEFNVSGLERGDLKSRFYAYRIALGRSGEMPWMTYDEIRKMENLPKRNDLKVNAGTTPQKGDNNEPSTAAAG